MIREKSKAKAANFQSYNEKTAQHKLLFVTSGRDSADDILRRKLLREARRSQLKATV